MLQGQYLVNLAGKGNLLTPGRKFMMGKILLSSMS